MQTLGLSDSTPKPTSRLKDLFRPDLSSEAAARTVCHSAAWACFIIGAVSTILSFFIEYASVFDAMLFFLIGLGLWRAWRTAAIAGFVLYIAEQVTLLASGHMPSVLALFIAVILFNGVRASFAYQKLRRTHQPPPLLPTQTGA
jgi:hypothetical protein